MSAESNTTALRGSVTLNKRIREHPIWSRDQPSYGQAWMDLILLANDQDRQVTLKGTTYTVKRGQLCRSLLRLEADWRRSGEWITAFMNFCKDQGMIRMDASKRRTLITIINYDVYNPIKPVTETDKAPVTEPVTEPVTKPVAEPNTETVTEPVQKQEIGIGRRKQEGAAAEIPSIAEVRQWAEMSGVDPDYAEHQHNKTEAGQTWLRAGRLADWKGRWLGFWLQDRGKWLIKKNGAPVERDEDAPPPPPKFKLTLDMMKGNP